MELEFILNWFRELTILATVSLVFICTLLFRLLLNSIRGNFAKCLTTKFCLSYINPILIKFPANCIASIFHYPENSKALHCQISFVSYVSLYWQLKPVDENGTNFKNM